MLGIEMMLKSLGVDPEMLKKFAVDMSAAVAHFEAQQRVITDQLARIETMTAATYFAVTKASSPDYAGAAAIGVLIVEAPSEEKEGQDIGY